MSVNIRTVPPGTGSSSRHAIWWWLALGAFVEVALAVLVLAGGSVPLRTLFGLPLVLVIPGYALTALLWGRHQLGAPERVVLSIGISLALARGFPDDEFFLLSDQPFDATGGPAVQRGVEIAGGEGAEVTLGNLGRGGHERVGVGGDGF